MTIDRNGSLVEIDGRAALRFERRYPQPIERVWRAVTAPEEMAQWFPSNVEGERAVGADLVFVDDAQRAAARAADEPTRDDGPVFRGTVVIYDPPQVFSFTWGGELLRYELHRDGDGTRLVFTQILGHRSTAGRNGAGWHMCLLGLDRLLGDDQDPPSTPDLTPDLMPDWMPDWLTVYDDYVDRLGLPLGAPGGDGSMTWEVSTHVDAGRVEQALRTPEERRVWGAGARADDPLQWEIRPNEHGVVARVTHRAIGRDTEAAAAWQALMVQLDMYLASGQVIPVDASHWTDAYRELLGR